jgi:uncharacterized coiled-coil protein SlyX
MVGAVICVDGGWLSELNHLIAELTHRIAELTHLIAELNHRIDEQYRLIAQLNHLIPELNHLIALPKPLNPPMNLQVGAVVCVDSARLRQAQGQASQRNRQERLAHYQRGVSAKKIAKKREKKTS